MPQIPNQLQQPCGQFSFSPAMWLEASRDFTRTFLSNSGRDILLMAATSSVDKAAQACAGQELIHAAETPLFEQVNISHACFLRII